MKASVRSPETNCMLLIKHFLVKCSVIFSTRLDAIPLIFTPRKNKTERERKKQTVKEKKKKERRNLTCINSLFCCYLK
jgi:hypothetical protein